MFQYIVRRTIGAVIVLLVVSILTFLIFQIAPKLLGLNLAYYYVGKIPPSPAGLKAIDHHFGFDLPVWEQYWNWLHGVLFGRTLNDGSNALVHCSAPCLGYSYRLNLPVTHMIAQALPIDFSVAIGAAFLWLLFGVTIGTISALKRGSFFDRASMTLALAAVSLPIFFTGPILQLVFAYNLKWLPSSGFIGLSSNPWQWFRHLIMPWVALAFLFAALYARLTRANMLETMSEDYIRTARAKGLPRRTVVLRHGLRAALTPIVTIFGLDFGTLIGTAVITETIFNLHGIGLLSIQAVTRQDLPVILGVTVIASIAVVLANMLVDIAYAFVDPRVSYS
jgi:peptide/nickel transport system permease protein